MRGRDFHDYLINQTATFLEATQRTHAWKFLATCRKNKPTNNVIANDAGGPSFSPTQRTRRRGPVVTVGKMLQGAFLFSPPAWRTPGVRRIMSLGKRTYQGLLTYQLQSCIPLTCSHNYLVLRHLKGFFRVCKCGASEKWRKCLPGLNMWTRSPGSNLLDFDMHTS